MIVLLLLWVTGDLRRLEYFIRTSISTRAYGSHAHFLGYADFKNKMVVNTCKMY